MFAKSHKKTYHKGRFFLSGRDRRIRTVGILLPKQALYQAELCPVKKLYFHNNLRHFALLAPLVCLSRFFAPAKPLNNQTAPFVEKPAPGSFFFLKPKASTNRNRRPVRLSYVPLKNFTFTIISDILLCSPRWFACLAFLLPQNRSTIGQSMLNAQYLIQNKLKCKLNFSTLQSTRDL